MNKCTFIIYIFFIYIQFVVVNQIWIFVIPVDCLDIFKAFRNYIKIIKVIAVFLKVVDKFEVVVAEIFLQRYEKLGQTQEIAWVIVWGTVVVVRAIVCAVWCTVWTAIRRTLWV